MCSDCDLCESLPCRRLRAALRCSACWSRTRPWRSCGSPRTASTSASVRFVPLCCALCFRAPSLRFVLRVRACSLPVRLVSSELCCARGCCACHSRSRWTHCSAMRCCVFSDERGQGDGNCQLHGTGTPFPFHSQCSQCIVCSHNTPRRAMIVCTCEQVLNRACVIPVVGCPARSCVFWTCRRC